MTRMLWVLVIVLSFSGCVQNVRPLNPDSNASYSSQAVYFATNRGRTGKANLNRFFDTKRSELSFGVSHVAIPSNYPRAQAANFIHWNLVLKRNPEKYLALVDIQPLSETDFLLQLGQRHRLNTPGLFFIHGYNVSFEKATRLSAKLAYDLGLSGPVVLFSWPSEESVTQYAIDEVNLQWAQFDLNRLLAQLLHDSQDNQLILMAHSLGNRALVSALLSVLNEQPELRSRLRGVVLAAPDIDAEIFARDIAPALVALQVPISLYVSDNDLALAASQRLHRYPRVGNQITAIAGIDTIDASAAEAEWLGHEYITQGAHTIADIYQWLMDGLAPAQRPGLEPIADTPASFWRITAD